MLQCGCMADPLVDALKALLQKHGRKKVALDAGVGDQTLYQIAAGIALPSGKHRGVGRALAGKLDDAFPGWRVPQAEPQLPPAGFTDRHQVSESDWALLQDIKHAATQQELDTIRKRAREIEAMVRREVAKYRSK
jgi:hypothetical protein